MTLIINYRLADVFRAAAAVAVMLAVAWEAAVEVAAVASDSLGQD